MEIDWLTITTPEDGNDPAWLSFHNMVSLCGARQTPGQVHAFTVGTSGMFRVSRRNGSVVYSASGGALTELRSRGLYSEFLWGFADGPHRVTRMDIAYDVVQDAPPILNSIWQSAHASPGLSFTRKVLKPSQLSRLVSMGVDGVETGTVYLGRRTAEVYARIYDKRQERLDRAGFDIGHPLTRYELCLTSKTGITLSDAYTPTNVFWHFMGKSIMKKPRDTSPWSPNAEGYTLPPRDAVLPADMMRRRVESSIELETLALLAAEMGPGGSEMLLRLVREKLSASARSSTDQPQMALRAI